PRRTDALVRVGDGPTRYGFACRRRRSGRAGASTPRLLDGLGVAGIPEDEQQLDFLVAPLREKYVAADREILAHVAALQREGPDLLIGLTLRLLHSCGSASDHAFADTDRPAHGRTGGSRAEHRACDCADRRANRASAYPANRCAGHRRLELARIA